MHYFSRNKFYYRISVLDHPVETHIQAILTVGISFYKLVFTIKTHSALLRIPLVTFLYAMPQMEETITMHIALFDTTLMHCENF